MAGRILIADDIATNRLGLRVRLTEARYEVIATDSEAGVISTLRRSLPDLLILTARLGGVDAAELCRRIRADVRLRDVSTLVLLGDGDKARRIEALEAGADEVLERPFTEFGLIARVRALLRARETRAETVRRQETAASFGFAEAQSAFARQDRVTIIAADPERGARLCGSLRAESGAKVELSTANTALDAASNTEAVAAYVIDADLRRPGGGLALLSELRSRSGARHAAILYAHRVEDGDAAASALDLGANDLIPVTAEPAEMALRLRTQLRRKHEADALRRTVEDGLRLAATDPLTGLYNRRYAMTYLDRAATEARRTNKPFAVMVADLDHFKKINDTYGHGAGDAVLKVVADTLRDGLRGEDLVARMGGEEFLIVMPATDKKRAGPVAERLRQVISASPVTYEPGQDPIRVTMSIGGAISRRLCDATDIETLMARADEALYRAKSEGRNKVDIWTDAA